MVGQPEILLILVTLLGVTSYSYLKSRTCSMGNSCSTRAEMFVLLTA